MEKQYANTSTIGEKWATVVVIPENGTGEARVISFIYGTNAVRSMVESGEAYRALGERQYLVGTDANHLIGY